MIELDRVTKRYGDMVAVDALDLTISAGRVTGVARVGAGAAVADAGDVGADDAPRQPVPDVGSRDRNVVAVGGRAVVGHRDGELDEVAATDATGAVGQGGGGPGGEGARGKKKAASAEVEQVLDFTLDELREARLVPVLDFKGRRRKAEPAAEPVAGDQSDDGGREE